LLQFYGEIKILKRQWNSVLAGSLHADGIGLYVDVVLE